MGHVDNQRIERIQAYMIASAQIGSKDMPSIYEFYPLPYDDELKAMDKKDVTESLEDWYKLAQSELAGITWKN